MNYISTKAFFIDEARFMHSFIGVYTLIGLIMYEKSVEFKCAGAKKC